MSTPSTYMAVGGVLLLLVMLTLWREMATDNTGEFYHRSFGALTFAVSRAMVIVFSASLVGSHTLPPLMFVVLNLVCMYLAVRSMPFAIAAVGEALDLADHPDDTPAESPAIYMSGERRTLQYQMALFALAGALVYVVIPHTGGGSLRGFINVLLLVATVRAYLEMLRVANTARNEMRLFLILMTAALITSWIAIIGTSAFTGVVSVFLLRVSRGADVAALVCGLFSMQSSYLVQGFYHRKLASWKHREAERAKAEVQHLNRVASDLYDDSSSMIQRQQDHFRNLAARVDGLEKIVQIGIRIQKRNDLKELLQMVVDLIRDELGFRTVILRLLNDRTQSFETRAFTGINPDAEEVLLNHRVPLAEYRAMLDARTQIGKSYFVRRETNDVPAESDTGTIPGAVLASDHWSEIDRLIVPLVDDNAEGQTIGYISVGKPHNPDLSLVDAIDHLDMIATLSVVAIRNATYYKDVREKNKKLKQYAEQLSGLNQLKSNFVATVSHEFRTPLTSIRAYCETLLKSIDDVDRSILKEFLVVIDEESNRLMALIEDILDFSHMEKGSVRFERTPCNLSGAVRDVQAELRSNFEKKHITLGNDLPDRDILVRGEPELMRQLLINLLQNAAKFTPEGGNVWLRVEDESVSVRIVVEDDGIGIEEDQIDKIFDQFHQVDNSSTRKYGGTGMGLAIVKNIVDWHDGNVWVENMPGRGTRFVVVIPKKQVIVHSHVFNLDGTMRRYEVERYLESLVEMVAELMNVKKASLMLRDPDTEELRIECAIGLDESIVEETRVRVGEGIAGRVAREKRSYLVEDIDADRRINLRNNNYVYDSKSFLSVPVLWSEEVVGVINVADPVARPRFAGSDCRLLEFFADRVSQAVVKLRDFVGRSHEFESVRSAFRGVLDSNRYVDNVSTDAVATVLDRVAVRLSLSQEEHATLRYAFSVYDLGLSRVGYSVIKRPGRLSDRDRESIRRHTIEGTEMLESVEENSAVRDAVLYHHENFDGSGYPAGIQGDEIPVLARVLRVADTFRALISRRPYQKQYTVGEAVEVLRRQSGSAFDPAIVQVFVDVATEEVDRFADTDDAGVELAGETVEAPFGG